MGKTIKVIDLFNIISKSEQPPKKIKMGMYFYEWNGLRYVPTNNTEEFLEHFRIECALNNEVEISEEDKEIEFEDIEEIDIHLGMLNMTPTEKHISNHVNQLIKNQKTLIKLVNELKKGK